MTTDVLVANYSPIGDIISIFTCVVLLFVMEGALHLIKDKKFFYLESALHYIFVGSLANIAFWYVAIKFGRLTGLIYILRDIYHLCFFMCLYCFIVYMKNLLDIKGKLVKVLSYTSRTLFVICTVMDVFSPFTGIGLHRDNGQWCDPMISFYNFFYAYCVLLLFCSLSFNAKRLVKSVKNCLIITWVVVAVIMGYQACVNINSFTSFTYILPLLVVMILLHSKPYDETTGSQGLASFENFVKEATKPGVYVDYVALKFNTNVVDYMPKELGKAISSFWIDLFKNVLIFNITSDLFIFAIPKESREEDTSERTRILIENDFQKYYKIYQISYKLIGLFNIDFIENSSDLTGMISMLLHETEDNTYLVVDDKKKEELKTYKLVKSQLEDIDNKKDPFDPRVLAYCQPIRNMKTGRFDTAEALMRMNIPGYGIVMPNIFIPLAEDYNYIHILTKIMLNKVCSQIKEFENAGYDFNRISVNFTASELREENFCDELFNIINKYGIEPSKIGVELTESQTERDFAIVLEKIKILRNAGMTVYLDDIGTGYSNLDRIVRYDVDVVKFDRFFLLEAEKSMKIVKMLNQLSQAFSDLGYKLLYEGVETDAHEALCLNCDADYIQGFKYSKPIPIEEFKDFLKDENKDENPV